MNNKIINRAYISLLILVSIVFLLSVTFPADVLAGESTKKPIHKKIAYIVSDIRIPFWDIMGRGIKSKAQSLGYDLTIYSAENSAKKELQSVIRALKDKVSGIIVSPTSSSACVTILKLAQKAKIPVVISDIGTDSGEYVSFISSDNKEGAYQVGKVLAEKIKDLGWKNASVGIVAIPQKRINGQLRTAGFMLEMEEAGIKGSQIKQQSDFSYQETYDHSKALIKNNPTLRAIFIQGSNRYQGALDAISDTRNKNKILLVSFDAEPVFLDLIPKGILIGAAMQQPYLMGETATDSLVKHLQGSKVKKNKQLSILAISNKNIKNKLHIINRNVLGITKN